MNSRHVLFTVTGVVLGIITITIALVLAAPLILFSIFAFGNVLADPPVAPEENTGLSIIIGIVALVFILGPVIGGFVGYKLSQTGSAIISKKNILSRFALLLIIPVIIIIRLFMVAPWNPLKSYKELQAKKVSQDLICSLNADSPKPASIEVIPQGVNYLVKVVVKGSGEQRYTASLGLQNGYSGAFTSLLSPKVVNISQREVSFSTPSQTLDFLIPKSRVEQEFIANKDLQPFLENQKRNIHFVFELVSVKNLIEMEPTIKMPLPELECLDKKSTQLLYPEGPGKPFLTQYILSEQIK